MVFNVKSREPVEGFVLPSQAALLVAVLGPTLLALNLAPSSTFFNQAASLIGWGLVIVVLPSLQQTVEKPRWELALLLLPLAILLIEALVSWGGRGLPPSLALSAVGLIVAAAITSICGSRAGGSPYVSNIFKGLCFALLVAGIAGGALGCVQVFFPDVADTVWIAATAPDGRASGNLRQPNHLSSLLVWSLVALAWLRQSDNVPSPLSWALGAFAVFCIVLTGSRTGLVDVGLLAAWGLCDRRLSKPVRVALMTLPLIYAVSWWGMREWAHTTGGVFGGEARMGAQGDISSSRYAIWSDTLSLIRQHPWFGVGFGEFNFAWSLTPSPHRPVAFFDHTHNIALQFAVELGVPMAVVLMIFLLVAIALAFINSARVASQERSSVGRAASMIVLMIGVHSMLEYPLWYAYFLLPCAFAFGLALSIRDVLPNGDDAHDVGFMRTHGWRLAGAGLLICGVLSVIDYFRVVPIFEAGGGTTLEQRIAEGRHSVLFSHQADYAAATTAATPALRFSAFSTATHNLLDTRLMMAWAKAYAERGDIERARYIAARLREFRNPDADEFFAECERKIEPRPFQCQPPSRQLNYLDFR
jgi:O-antigen ligase